MPRHNKPIEQLSANQASANQQDMVNCLNPDIERKQRAAVDSSPKHRPSDCVTFPVTDQELLTLIESEGLTSKMLSIGRLEWQHRKGADKTECLLAFIERHGRVFGMSNYKENSLSVRNELKNKNNGTNN